MIVGDYYSGTNTSNIVYCSTSTGTDTIYCDDYIITTSNNVRKLEAAKILFKINSINDRCLKILAEVLKSFRVYLRTSKWFGYWIRAGPF